MRQLHRYDCVSARPDRSNLVKVGTAVLEGRERRRSTHGSDGDADRQLRLYLSGMSRPLFTRSRGGPLMSVELLSLGGPILRSALSDPDIQFTSTSACCRA